VGRIARACQVLPGRVPAEKVEDACRNANTSELLVVDEQGHILGVVGPQDVARARLQARLDPDPDEDPMPLVLNTAASLARPLLVQVDPDTAIAEVSAIMAHTAARRVVVVDRGRPAGQVLLADVEAWFRGLTAAWPLSSFAHA
jgi:predicted transcriptional regulator